MSVKTGDCIYFVHHRLNEIKEIIVTEEQADNINRKFADFELQNLLQMRMFDNYSDAEKFLSELNESLIAHYERDIELITDKIEFLKTQKPRLIRGVI
jgi:hypothetical protein